VVESRAAELDIDYGHAMVTFRACGKVTIVA